MTPDESVNEIAKLADAAGAAIGPSWKLASGGLTPDEDRDPGSQVCYLPNGDKGTNYQFLWMGSGVPDPEKTITEIQAAWEKLGVKATITKVGKDGLNENAIYLDDPPHLTGAYPDGYYISLMIASNWSSFQATTHCIPIPDQYLYHPGDSFPPIPGYSDPPSTGTENQPTP